MVILVRGLTGDDVLFHAHQCAHTLLFDVRVAPLKFV